MMSDVMTRPHQLIASDRVEGTAVRRPNGDKIGHIERLMIDKVTGKVSYAILSFGGFLGMGTSLLPLPWARLTYNTAFEAYQLDIDDDELRRAPSFRADKDFDWGIARRKRSCIAITEYRHTGAVSDRGSPAAPGNDAVRTAAVRRARENAICHGTGEYSARNR